ncbi:MAG: hypothetical protein VYD05_13730, partial [Planctomycetota bacterium]|nr:hypothetical protein [Planctomycetota bacterium]
AKAAGGDGGKGGDDGVVAGGGAAEAGRAVDEVAVAGEDRREGSAAVVHAPDLVAVPGHIGL